ncbi:MAG: DUF427 domain-containing protein [Marivivens sp.]|jgi:uncharacterized protein (DUF427 family)|nr:DUF427 domain-containing protein [Marivivens sp.]
MSDTLKIRPVDGTWVVRAGGAVIGESNNVLELIEGDFAPVLYFPRQDIAMAFLDANANTFQCPYKGRAQFYNIIAKSGPIPDAAWSYEDPSKDVEKIRDHLAFYTSKVTVEEV